MRQKRLKSLGRGPEYKRRWSGQCCKTAGMKCKTRGISITGSATALLMGRTSGMCTSPACTNSSLNFTRDVQGTKQSEKQPTPQPQNSDIQGQLQPSISTAEKSAINSICQQGEMPNKWKKVKRAEHKRWGIKLNKTNQSLHTHTHTSSAVKERKDSAPGEGRQDKRSIYNSN